MIEKINKWIPSVTLVVLVILMVLVGGNQSVPRFAGITNYDALELNDGLMVTASSTQLNSLKIGLGGGSNGTLSSVLTGTCTFIGTTLSVAATTTQAFDCAVTGARAGDNVFVQLATSTPTLNEGWTVVGANASTTNDFITIKLFNGIGAATTTQAASVNSAGVYDSNAATMKWASSTRYWIVR